MSTVRENDTVILHFTGKFTDGEVFDSSVGGEPIEVELGKGELIPGFEKGLIGMTANEKKTITIVKEDAYGDIDDALFYKIPKSELPQDTEIEVGMELIGNNLDGSQYEFVIVAIEEEDIVVDGNHPLAGHDLVFDLEVIEIL